MTPIKRVYFEEPIRESFFGGENTTDKILFLAHKWYKVEYETYEGLIYLYNENNEKIAIDIAEMKGVMLIQR